MFAQRGKRADRGLPGQVEQAVAIGQFSVGGLADPFGGRRTIGQATRVEQSFHVASVIAPFAGRCPDTGQSTRGSPAGNRGGMYPQDLCRLGAGQYRGAGELAGHCDLRRDWRVIAVPWR